MTSPCSGARVADAVVMIPHWNRADRLRRALRALEVQTVRVPVWVIDNGSTDETHEMLAREFDQVRCLRLNANRGFGGALNEGVRRSSAGLVIFLNNDAVADRRFVEEMIAAQAASGAEMIAGCLRAGDGTVESVGVEIDRSLIAYDVGHGESHEELLARPELAPLAPSGGAAAFVREAFLSVGGFDEGFFAYLEDVELGIRMQMGGMRCVAAPRAFAWHEHSTTLGPGSSAKNRLMGRSRAYLLWKYRAALDLPARLRGMLIDGLVYSGQALVHGNAGALRGRLEARSELAARRPPPPDPRFAAVPAVRRATRHSLGIRLRRGIGSRSMGQGGS
jgi:GT2 family glycosyltransferase